MGRKGVKNKRKKASDKKELNKDNLGIIIGGIYNDVMEKLLNLIGSQPEYSNIKPEVEALHEETITQLVELGKIKETLDEGSKQKVDYDLFETMQSLSKEKYKQYSEAVKYYRSQDNDFANFLSGFNIITQYADFGLLKKQKPEEFERLGLDN